MRYRDEKTANRVWRAMRYLTVSNPARERGSWDLDYAECEAGITASPTPASRLAQRASWHHPMRSPVVGTLDLNMFKTNRRS
jgi:hypothetical protein